MARAKTSSEAVAPKNESTAVCPWPSLPFIVDRPGTGRRRSPVREFFAAPQLEYSEGCALGFEWAEACLQGLRTGEVKQHLVPVIVERAVAALADEPGSLYGTRGVAVGFLHGLALVLEQAAHAPAVHAALAQRAEQAREFNREQAAERESEKEAFVARMAAGRACRRAARMAAGSGSPQQGARGQHQ